MNYGPKKVKFRDMILANTDFVGTMANIVAPVVNFTLGMKPVKVVMDKVMAIDHRRSFPKYSGTKFETWYKRNAAAKQSQYANQVSYFHGCYVNYNFPKLGQDLVKIMNALGYGVQLLEKEKCCGVALMSNGLIGQATKQAKQNVASIRKAGNKVLTTSSTCTFTIRDEYPHLLGVDNADVRDNVSLATRFIYQLIEEGKAKIAFRKDYKARVGYQTACHMEKMGWKIYSISMLKMIPGVDLVELDSTCCGIGGTYGFKKENYETSQKIGSPLFKQIEESGLDFVATDCETCKWQIEMSTTKQVLNPISVIADALDVEETIKLNKK
jgi:glycerol-3-phosphate dehydrogenase subunit C